jgi:arginine/lysine/ornithine decarboxylase
MRSKLSLLPRVSYAKLSEMGFECDPTKTLFKVEGMSGHSVKAFLKDECGVLIQRSSIQACLPIVFPANTRADVDKLFDGLERLAKLGDLERSQF